jgi:hypothetical protein
MPTDRNDNIDPALAVNNFLGGVGSTVANIAGKAAASVQAFTNPANLVSNIRSKDLPKDGIAGTRTLTQATTATKPGEKDWRVKLSLPSHFVGEAMAPLTKTGGLCFPYTPSIIVSHNASYTPINPVHTNYTMNSYNNSTVDQITINADFFVQNALEARYWVAAVHYLRSVTKMKYGESSSDAGSPPPVVLLNGYGDFVFKNIPVIVTQFQFDLPQDVDYISCTLEVPELEGQTEQYNTAAWAPTQSLLTVTVQPQYSRSTISQFNMDSFINGEYIKKSGGFI